MRGRLYRGLSNARGSDAGTKQFSNKLNNTKTKYFEIKGMNAIGAAARTTCMATCDVTGATTAAISRLSSLARFAVACFDVVPICELTPSAATASLLRPSTYNMNENVEEHTVHYNEFSLHRYTQPNPVLLYSSAPKSIIISLSFSTLSLFVVLIAATMMSSVCPFRLMT